MLTKKQLLHLRIQLTIIFSWIRNFQRVIVIVRKCKSKGKIGKKDERQDCYFW